MLEKEAVGATDGPAARAIAYGEDGSVNFEVNHTQDYAKSY